MDDKLFESLERAISKDRLDHYSQIFNESDKKIIIQRYLLNVELSKALYFPLQTLETTLRNNIHTVLSEKLNNEFWFEDTSFMNPRTIEKKDVLKAKRNIDDFKVKTSGRIISELNFGFWSYLFGKYYEQKIWNRYIKLIFPNIPKNMARRKKISEKINSIKNLRNKVFHFDTILNIKNLFELYNQILEVIYWLNKDVYNLTITFDEFEYIYKNEEEIIKEKLESLSRRANEKL